MIVGRRGDVLAESAAAISEEVPDAPKVIALRADVSDPDDVERLRADLGDRYGRLDVLVNNAGGNIELHARTHGDGLAGTAERWLGNFRANVLTAVPLTEALQDLLISPGGRVVLMSSIAAIRGSGTGSYGSVKVALHPYAFTLAAAWGPRGITVNVVAPGYIEDTEFFGGRLPDQRRRTLIQEALNRRAGRPQDVAATIR